MRISTHTLAAVRAERELTVRLAELTVGANSMMSLRLQSEQDAHIWIAWEGDVIVGWALRFILPDKPEPLAYMQFFVAPEHRRKGIGSALANEAARFAGETRAAPWRTFGWTAEALGFFTTLRESAVVPHMEVVVLASQHRE